MGIISFLKNLFSFKPKYKRKKIKCKNCGHNISRCSGRWWHRTYNPGLRPGEDGDDPNEFGFFVYKVKCGYKGCKCKKPLPKNIKKKR